MAQTKTSDVTLRLAQDDDAEAISSLLHESFAEFESLYNPESFAATAILSEQVSKRITEGRVWVAVSDKRVVGTVSVIPRGIRFTSGGWRSFLSPEVNELENDY